MTGLAFAGSIVALQAAAFADGMPSARGVSIKDAPMSAPASRWSGFYAGVNAGAAWTSSDVSNTVCASDPSTCYYSNFGGGAGGRSMNAIGNGSASDTAFTGGGQIGYNWQSNNVLLGVEADINSMRTSASRSATAAYGPGFTTGGSFTDTVSTDWLITTRARLGYATGNMLAYFTGGLAFANVKHTHSFGEYGFGTGAPCGSNNINFCEFPSSASTKTGWTIGGGVEWALDARWSLKAEYLYADFGSVSSVGSLVTNNGSVVSNGAIAHSADLTLSTVRAGLNYKF